jgi:hypothetical protein
LGFVGGPVRLVASFESLSAFKGFFHCSQLDQGFQVRMTFLTLVG